MKVSHTLRIIVGLVLLPTATASAGGIELRGAVFSSGGAVLGGSGSVAVLGEPFVFTGTEGGGSPLVGFVTLLGDEPGCNAADLTEPFDVLDLGDISVFIDGFIGGETVSDLDGNGIFDLADISLFTSAFLAGCP